MGFLQTPSGGDALALLLAFGSAITWREDFPPLVLCHAWRTRPGSAASPQQSSLRAVKEARSCAECRPEGCSQPAFARTAAPRAGRAAEAAYWTTSSVRSTSEGGNVRPSVAAVVRLTAR